MHDGPSEPLSPAADGAAPADELFRRLVESVGDYAIFMLDRHGRVASWNAGARNIKGYAADEIIGQHFSRFYPAEAVAARWPDEELRRAERDGRFEDEGWRIRKDGSRFWASVVITALRDADGRPIGFAKVTRDLTERRQHEETLRRSEEQLRLLVESLREYAIFLLDTAGRIQTWNAGARAIHGFDEADVLGREHTMFFTPADVAAGRPAAQLRAASNGGRCEVEGWRLRRDGQAFWAHVVITPVHDARGALRGYAAVTRDQTGQRRLAELEQTSRRMNEFIAMLGHELRNPLTPICNAATLMALQEPLTPQLERIQKVIARQSEQLVRLVDDLLDVGRIVTGKIALKLEAMDFREVAAASVEAARAQAAAAHQRLSLECDAGVELPLRGDVVRLVQALGNLIGNAIRYTPEGGEIRVEARKDGPTLIARVSDTGYGLAPDALERIFDMFVQEEDVPRSPATAGLGIGLVLARRVAELHRGTLIAESAGLGRGSTFTMTMPLETPGSGKATPAAPPRAALPVPISRVLVVDDNHDAADSLVQVLAAMGHQARAAYDADDALQAAREFEPRVVLLDIKMPGASGYAVLQRLRQQQSPGQFLYIAALTGLSQIADPQRHAIALGFQAHLIKPVSMARLRQLLREADIAAQPSASDA
ncbi:MAG TPA: PAS domain S-box protein [Burkholderiaceae bacterium]|nr:PAS domain S-box protein [Burkholderiaceae bacterium]